MMKTSLNLREMLINIAPIALLVVYGILVDPDTGRGGFPCLWKALFEVSCPGCGLSRAGALLLHGRVQEALAVNWLIVPLAAAIVTTRVRRSTALLTVIGSFTFVGAANNG